MNKSRLEALSDGVFAIVMTILVFSIEVPKLTDRTDGQLLSALLNLGPVFLSYFVSFMVLAMFWLSHHFIYSVFTKNIDRVLALLNILFLSFVAVVPFSAQLLGTYPGMPIAGVVYGVNLAIISIITLVIINYAEYSDEIDTSHIEDSTLRRATIRVYLTLACSTLGVAAALVHNDLSLVFFMLPILFTASPRTFRLLERATSGIEIERNKKEPD